MDLSIIIALYNTEKYIEKCIQSVLDCPLAYSEYEIIVINDGSTDSSKLLVEQIISSNPEAPIKLINKENGGQSTARNIGFDIAQGQYIFCLDSDDFVDSSELSKALKFAVENDLDLLPIFLDKYNEDSKQLSIAKDNYEKLNSIINGGEFLNNFVIYGSMCRYFYKKKIIDDNKLRLIEGVFHEDEEFVIKFISYSNRIGYQKHKVYHQIVRGNSTTNNKNLNHRTKLLYDLTEVIIRLCELRNIFDKNSLQFSGISMKIEQLLLSLFMRMKKDKISKIDKENIVLRLKRENLFPLKFRFSTFKFYIYSIYINAVFS